MRCLRVAKQMFVWFKQFFFFHVTYSKLPVIAQCFTCSISRRLDPLNRILAFHIGWLKFLDDFHHDFTLMVSLIGQRKLSRDDFEVCWKGSWNQLNVPTNMIFGGKRYYTSTRLPQVGSQWNWINRSTSLHRTTKPLRYSLIYTPQCSCQPLSSMTVYIGWNQLYVAPKL